LINEILDLSKVEAGKMPMIPKPFRLIEVRDYLDQTFRHVAEQKGLSFEVQMDPQLPESAFTDLNRLQQILKNLLSNAFKFTSEGAVVLRVARGPASEDSGTMLSFAVQDTGIGIPPEKQKLIFEAFQQADGTTSRKYGGTGLGLTISREIARLLGGSIQVVSSPGQGSTFTLLLPANYAGPDATWREEAVELRAEPEDIEPLPESADLAGTRVLLVDDDRRNIFALRTVLEARGIQVLHADNGKIALDMIQSNPHLDLVLMDTMMPEMDGLTAIREIRGTLGLQTLPIVSLTAKAMKGDREKALEAGAWDYVTKPVDPQRLLSVIHRWREQRRQAPAAAQA
jgi:CheY-like chemotaxis protein